MPKLSNLATSGVQPLPAAGPLRPATTSVLTIALTLTAMTVLGLALRLYRLDASSLWSDEAFSAYWIQRDLGFLWTEGLVIETTPPLYYMLLKGWVAIAGDSDFALRLFSALASAATIPLVFVLALEFAAVPAALLAALLFALAPMQLYYAQEARVYALVPLIFAVTLLGLARLLRTAQASGPRPLPAAMMPLALYTAGAALLIYAHATSVFTVAALSACGGVLLANSAGRAMLPRFLLANLVVALLAVPQLYAILQQAGRQDLSWITPPDLVSLLNLLNNLFIDPASPQSLFRLSCIFAGAAVVLLVLSLPWRRMDRLTGMLLLGVPALFLAAVIGLSFRTPFLIPRIAIWLGVPLSILLGMALASRAPAWRRLGLAAAMAGCIVLGIGGVYVRALTVKEDWRGAMPQVLSQLGPDDMVVLGPRTSMLPMLRYAEGRFDDDRRPLYRWAPQPLPADLYIHHRVRSPTAVTTGDLAAAVAQGRRVWLLMQYYDWLRTGDAGLRATLPPATEDRSHTMVLLLRW